MKTLINKTNPAIRITAPEIIRWFTDFYVVKAEAGRKGRVLVVKSKDWTLVEEEPVKEEICSKCVYYKKDDGYCYYPHGGMQRRINENGVCECTGFCEKEQEEPLDLEKLALEKYPIQMVAKDPFDDEDDTKEDLNEYEREAYLEGLKKGYELGRKGGSK